MESSIQIKLTGTNHNFNDNFIISIIKSIDSLQDTRLQTKAR